jgi:hypothetical protein
MRRGRGDNVPATLTEKHHEWIAAIFGVDPRSFEKAGAPGSAPGGDAPGDDPTPAATPATSSTPPAPGALTDAAWAEAVSKSDWKAAAKAMDGVAASDIAARLEKLDDTQLAALHEGALEAGGKVSDPVVRATLNPAWGAAMMAKDWAKAARYLNEYDAAGIARRMSKQTPTDIAALHKAALADSALGVSSRAAIGTEIVAHPVIGSAQAGRAAALEQKLSEEDKKKYKALLDAATPATKDYLTKGLAANHSVAELEDFAKKIAGKDAKWLQDNLSLTGSSEGTGVKQQWHDSCGPTTLEAVRGELDPLYALQMHEDSPKLDAVNPSKATEINPKLAEDQRKILTDAKGIAVDRDKGGGRGMWIAEPLNKLSASTGLTYQRKKMGETGATVDDAVNTLNAATAAGEPVPIAIGANATNYQHYVLVTGSDPGPPRYYSIHDPWSGTTVVRSEDQLRNGKLDIANCNVLSAFDKPTPVEVK